MDTAEIEFVFEIIGQKPRVFHYFKDRYALMLLEYFVSANGKSLREIKGSAFAGLLRKSVLQQVLGNTPSGVLSAQHLRSVWPSDLLAYVLTLGTWPLSLSRRAPRWKQHWNFTQTSRRGHNLVLQLNFCSEHDRAYKKLLTPGKKGPFAISSHPISKANRNTMSWARLDFDLDTGEALIEEIQTDWIRLAFSMATTIERVEANEFGRLRLVRDFVRANGIDVASRHLALKKYLRSTLEKHRNIWAEATLAASIEFILKELGIRKIYYHTPNTGNWMKGISGRKPPRSLYSELPKHFCFALSKRPPTFLLNSHEDNIRKYLEESSRWHVLDLSKYEVTNG